MLTGMRAVTHPGTSLWVVVGCVVLALVDERTRLREQALLANVGLPAWSRAAAAGLVALLGEAVVGIVAS